MEARLEDQGMMVAVCFTRCDCRVPTLPLPYTLCYDHHYHFVMIPFALLHIYFLLLLLAVFTGAEGDFTVWDLTEMHNGLELKAAGYCTILICTCFSRPCFGVEIIMDSPSCRSLTVKKTRPSAYYPRDSLPG